MDIVKLRISYEFIRARTNLSWREIIFGLANDLLDRKAPAEFALNKMGAFEEPPTPLAALAGADGNARTSEYVEQLAAREPEISPDEVRGKWLYLAMAWLYEHRNEYADPLQRVEEVYADFDYPEQVAHFVRYMPMVGPDLGSPEANERRLFDRWKEYIDAASRIYVA